MNTTFHQHPLFRQRGMGATIVLFTIALIVLVGAALAYGSRGNSRAFSNESAKVMSSVLLKQSAEYRDAYNRYIFDGGVAGDMSFTVTAVSPAKALFDPVKQYGSLQAAPSDALSAAGAADWAYKKNAALTGVGGTSADSIVYVTNVKEDVCKQINKQMYGDDLATTPHSLGIALSAIGAAVALDITAGRVTGCEITSDSIYVFYSTLAEN
jgi:hypothetical protein